ncbi:acyl-CoA dehydrogenase family protein [Streptomyces hilarionis]|uniref:acyl-CoA dehydrogenase family protein n=1 Tax=Streptomyces hilarionis TaxID=2839954 RepID=UPI00211A2D14|nr:acyl-CoA dehydrogenase family protein [Streptomyces hilarionis]MCQ9135720.1 acyl-CoA dehydrogenase family protein [Streptomyces hilarionis]
MGVAIKPSQPASASHRTGPSPAHWLHVAHEMADDLATDAAAREHAGKPPFDEVSRLRESGLLNLLIPAELGGGGAEWPTAYAVVRAIAATDSAIAQLLGSHYFLSWSARFFTEPGLAARIERLSATEQWCWGGGFAAQDHPLTLTRKGRGYVLEGTQSYATGVLVADRLAVRAERAGNREPVAVVVTPTHPGVRIGAAESFGQRLAAGGDVGFDAVPVTVHDVLGSLAADDEVLSPSAALASPIGRLLSVQLLLGLAEGALAEARDYSRAAQSSWRSSWPDGSPQDPHVLTTYGELTILTRSAAALTDQALTAVHNGLARAKDLTYDEYADISVHVTMAEAAASRAAQESTSRALDVVGSRSASARLGLDRFWRNARAHTLHRPVAHQFRDAGDYFLNGAHPPFVLPA